MYCFKPFIFLGYLQVSLKSVYTYIFCFNYLSLTKGYSIPHTSACFSVILALVLYIYIYIYIYILHLCVVRRDDKIV